MLCIFFRIPQTDPSGQSIILPKAEFERITLASKALGKEEREALMDGYNRKKEEEIVKSTTTCLTGSKTTGASRSFC